MSNPRSTNSPSPIQQQRRSVPRCAVIAVGALVLIAGCGRTAAPLDTSSHPPVFQPIGPFYQPPVPLPPGRPGTLIRSEPLTAPAGYLAWKILYHSLSADDTDIAVSGFVVASARPAPTGGRPVLAYAHGVRGLASICAPSNTTDPLQALQNYTPLLTAGAAIVATDYPGLGAPGNHPYLVGQAEARSVLDSVRAAQQLPGVHIGNTVVASGDTQGGHAALFVGQIAAGYAPELHLVGVEAEDPPTDLVALERHAATTPYAVEFLMEAAAGYSATNPSADLRALLTPHGLTDLGVLQTECDDQFGQATVGQSVAAVFAKEPVNTPPWSTGLAANSAGAVRTPAPILITQGSADTVYPANITAGFVQHICQLGDTVDYRTYPQTGHAVTIAAVHDILNWIKDRFASQPAPNTCR